MKTVNVVMNLPVNLELELEMVDEGRDFDVKDVRFLPTQSISVSDVNENLDDDMADEIMRILRT